MRHALHAYACRSGASWYNAPLMRAALALPAASQN
jgi:hypothetical protein